MTSGFAVSFMQYFTSAFHRLSCKVRKAQLHTHQGNPKQFQMGSISVYYCSFSNSAVSILDLPGHFYSTVKTPQTSQNWPQL